MISVKFRIKVNGEWIVKEALVVDVDDVKEFCRKNDKIADWEIISVEELGK